MDGSAAEHSDSDSGESWTLLENTSSFGDDADALECGENTTDTHKSVNNEMHNDEDTDGISIISDSEPESAACDATDKTCLLGENHPPITHCSYNTPNTYNDTPNHNEYLQDTNVKHKTYVHRRNKRLSTMLNIIMLGSVITAAGVAIGHMWGAKYECNMHTTTSINKILSSLYKLKEENAFLRNKIKELTLANNMQLQQQKINEKIITKQHRCKKMFEEPLNNKVGEKGLKCVDERIDLNNIVELQHEKEFGESIEKLRHIYNENKSWLNPEIESRLKKQYGNNLLKKADIKNTLSHKTINLNQQIGPINRPNTVSGDVREPTPNSDTSETKVTYADSLKSEPPAKKAKRNDSSEMPTPRIKRQANRKKQKDDNIDSVMYNSSFNEEDIKKDDRYTAPRVKQERKKYDRQKLHKKQKRKNKYEQWEMKGGYLKDYDEFSVTSSIGNFVTKNMNQKMNPDFEIYINKFTETNVDQKPLKMDKRSKNKDKKDKRNKELDWYEKRSAMRNEARKKLEMELFGESSPNAAAWYFRRMQKREQCRAQKDNSTFKKIFKQKMNYKVKH